MPRYKITVLSDNEPEVVEVDLFEMASGPHYQEFGRVLSDIVNLRAGLATVEIERVG